MYIIANIIYIYILLYIIDIVYIVNIIYNIYYEYYIYIYYNIYIYIIHIICIIVDIWERERERRLAEARLNKGLLPGSLPWSASL